MAYEHGIRTLEQSTSVVPVNDLSASIPVVFGTAPINQCAEKNVNKPILCYTYADAVEAFGYSDDFENYTLCEFMHSFFVLYQNSPAVLVNVLNPEIHKIEASKMLVANVDELLLDETGVLIETITVAGFKAEDFSCAFDENNHVLITLNQETTGTLEVNYTKLDPKSVTKDDIIGGINGDGNAEGMELIGQIPPRFGIIPGVIIAPGFSHNVEVASVMVAKTEKISGVFTCMCISDVADTVLKYQDAVEWKSNFVKSENQIICFGKLRLGEKIFHMSTHLACLIGQVDAKNEGIPYENPSNKTFQANALVVNNNDLYLEMGQANFLNQNGITTAINFMGVFRAWGGQTSIYPYVSDVKDADTAVKRMFHFIRNNFVTTYISKVDNPGNGRLRDSVIDSYNIYLNGLSARGFLLGGRIEFLEAENPENNLMEGLLVFHVYMTPPSTGKSITGIVEIDISLYKNLYTAA